MSGKIVKKIISNTTSTRMSPHADKKHGVCTVRTTRIETVIVTKKSEPVVTRVVKTIPK